ncbi:MAG: hypothetical protein JSS62_07040, partial [Verrucomicrobia bacterium]|nr:hypothetical protein [Verrucomicrobiota bacterium]
EDFFNTAELGYVLVNKHPNAEQIKSALALSAITAFIDSLPGYLFSLYNEQGEQVTGLDERRVRDLIRQMSVPVDSSLLNFLVYSECSASLYSYLLQLGCKPDVLTKRLIATRGYLQHVTHPSFLIGR